MVVLDYKRLGIVEIGFRTLKGIDLQVRPIYHRLADRVRAHFLLCMLAYYVEWHMRQALAPLLYVEEDLASARSERDPVAKAKPTARAQRKRSTGRSEDGLRLRRWGGLLCALSTQVRNTCAVGSAKTQVTFTRATRLNAFQSRAFALLEANIRFGSKMCPVEGTSNPGLK